MPKILDIVTSEREGIVEECQKGLRRIENGELAMNTEAMIAHKKQECRALIETRYKEHDQLNVLRSGDADAIAEMNNRIDPILAEFRDGQENADFTRFK